MQSPAGRRPPTLDERLGRLDRRVVYLGLFFVTLLPLVLGWQLPLYVTAPAEALYVTIEALPQDKVVFVGCNWDAGTQAETGPQMVALVRHLIRRRLRFVLVSIGYPTSPQLGQTAVQEAILLEGVRDTWIYGRDWANLGYKQPDDPWLRAFTNNIRAGFNEDWDRTPLERIPVMEGVRRFGPAGEVSMMLEITGSPDTLRKWYEFLTPTRVEIGLGCTAVMAPEQYPFLDSGQLSGLLMGMKGAAEYEKLLNAIGQGSILMAGQSFAHAYIVFLILLGNVALLLGWRERRRQRR